jgi:predicted ATP-grasp superfamily ATP-dependent carboligase
MDKKTLITTVVTAVIVMLATTIVRDYMVTKGEGDNAKIALIVKQVVREEMELPNGKSYGQQLSEINDNQIVIQTKLEQLEKAMKVGFAN